jgi:alcohol dehydrogenase class IV
MTPFHFFCPVRIVFGRGRIQELENLLPPHYQRLLLVSDRGVMEKSGAVSAVRAALKKRSTAVFTAIDENPTFANIEKGAYAAQDAGAQIVIGIGGGSPMDAAKGIAMRMTNSGSVEEIVAGAPLAQAPLPVVCIPTTAGTGSETTPYVVFTDVENQNKCGFGHDALYPLLSVVDPELGYSMPRNLVIHTGLDALTHAIEAYLCRLATPMTDPLALQALTLILDNLTAAARHDHAAMDAMAYAAAIAGIAIANAGTVLLHVMAYPLTVFHHLPHGLANAVLLPRFIDFMKRKAPGNVKVAKIEALFAPTGGVRNYIHALGISTSLGDHGVRPEEIALFAKKTIVKNDVALTPTLEPISEADIAALFDSDG